MDGHNLARVKSDKRTPGIKQPENGVTTRRDGIIGTVIRDFDMPRNMSFAMTTGQIKARTKTVTRRFGWWFLGPGDEVRAVEKAMGLKKGERIKPLAMLRIVSTRSEPLNAVTEDELIKEGFPEWTPTQFVQMLVDHYKVDPTEIVNRIEFEYHS